MTVSKQILKVESLNLRKCKRVFKYIFRAAVRILKSVFRIRKFTELYYMFLDAKYILKPLIIMSTSVGTGITILHQMRSIRGSEKHNKNFIATEQLRRSRSRL